MRLVAALLSACLLVLLTGPLTIAAAPPVALAVTGTPFDPRTARTSDRVEAELEIGMPARVTVRVRDFDDRIVRVLTYRRRVEAGSHSWVWAGRDANGRIVPYGPYRIEAIVDAGGISVRRRTWVTRSARVPYATRPGAIVVALDPGHGGPAGGATWRRLVEDDVNLDISLRLEAMLRGAGIGVVMTRRRDRNVSPAGRDISGDHRYSRLDELIARNDIANRVGADVHIAIHNNASSCHCTRGTTMYTHDRRSWSPEGRRLARFVQEEHLRHLRRLKGYRPRDRGVRFHDFKALMPYRRLAMPRPSLQPSILGESLFVDWPSERRILARRSGRTLVAAAYFDGIARYLAWRRHGIRYEVLDAPRSVRGGGEVAIKLRITNRGHSTSAVWRVSARVVRAVRRYDGRPRRGTVRARTRMPDGLSPGESAVVTIRGITMPVRTGAWLVKLDIDLPGGDNMARHGVVGPQVRVRTTAP